MTKHYNPSIVENANRILASKAGDYLSDDVSNILQPTILITANERQLAANNRQTTGTSVLLTASSDKDTYLTSIQISITADAACDSTTYTVNQVLEGVTLVIARLVKTTLTAYNQNLVLTWPRAIKLQRGAALNFTNSFTVGTTNFSVTAFGYTEEVTR